MDVVVNLGRLNRWSIEREDATPGNYLLYSDGVAIWRKGVREGDYVLDKALTLTGFDGIENIDWINVYIIN